MKYTSKKNIFLPLHPLPSIFFVDNLTQTSNIGRFSPLKISKSFNDNDKLKKHLKYMTTLSLPLCYLYIKKYSLTSNGKIHRKRKFKIFFNSSFHYKLVQKIPNEPF